MKRPFGRRLIALAGSLLALVTTIINPAQAENHDVVLGDTAWKVYGAQAPKVCRASIAARTIKSGNCNKLAVGDRLIDPDAGNQTSAPPAPVPAQVANDRQAVTVATPWRVVGGNPVLTPQESAEWNGNGIKGLHPKQVAAMQEMGFNVLQITETDANLRKGKCNVGFIPKGGEVAGMATGGRRHLGRTVNRTADGDVPMWHCPDTGGREVYVVMKCGNVAWNPAPKKPQPPVVATREEKALLCEKFLHGWGQAQLGGEGVAAASRMGCLLQVGENGRLGAALGGNVGRYWSKGQDGKTWTSKSWFVGFGPEYRYDGEVLGGVADNFEVFVLGGVGSAEGGNGPVAATQSIGGQVSIGINLKKVLGLGNGTTLTVRAMGFGELPFGGKGTDILVNGQKVGQNIGRHMVAGLFGRLELDKAEWKIRPELTFGGWYTWDVINSLGVKVLVGFSTKDQVWRVGVGPQCVIGVGCIAVAEVEYNPIMGVINLTQVAASEALSDGATSSADYLGVKPQKSAKGFSATASTKGVRAQSRKASTPEQSARTDAKIHTVWDMSDSGPLVAKSVKNPKPSTPEQSARTDAKIHAVWDMGDSGTFVSKNVQNPKPSTPAQIVATDRAHSGGFNDQPSSGWGG